MTRSGEAQATSTWAMEAYLRNGSHGSSPLGLAAQSFAPSGQRCSWLRRQSLLQGTQSALLTRQEHVEQIGLEAVFLSCISPQPLKQVGIQLSSEEPLGNMPRMARILRSHQAVYAPVSVFHMLIIRWVSLFSFASGRCISLYLSLCLMSKFKTGICSWWSFAIPVH